MSAAPAGPGRPRRIDYEYRRTGTCNLFTTIEPLAGWRHIGVTDRRTAVAECELAVLASQCLARRLGGIDTARREITAWERQRNVERPTVT